MRKTPFALASVILFFAACQSKDASTESVSFDSSIVTTNTKMVSTEIAKPDTTGIVQPVVAPNTIQNLPGQAVTVSPNAATAAVAAPGMNPAHGQPGHRCDIAVGAPLNSAPAKTTTTATPTITTQPVVTTTTAAPVKTAPGMNPPHGQPGHRCDIAVGAPLNSAPAKTDVKAAVSPQVIPAVISDSAKK